MITGNVKVKSESNFGKKVGIFEGEVVKVNPDAEWFAENGMELKEGSKSTEYLSVNPEGFQQSRISFWIKNSENQLFNNNFYLVDKEKVSLDGIKKQYINSKGVCSWADSEENLPSWFTTTDFRVAKMGEEELYNFLRAWLDDLELKDASTVLSLDWRKLINGNVREITEQISGQYAKPVVLVAVIKTKDTPEGTKEYQGVFNKAATQSYNMKYFRTRDFDNTQIELIMKKKPSNRKGYEKFIAAIVDPKYGCKDFYSLKPLHDYDPAENIVGRRDPVPQNTPDY